MTPAKDLAKRDRLCCKAIVSAILVSLSSWGSTALADSSIPLPKNAISSAASWSCKPVSGEWECHQTVGYSGSIYDPNLRGREKRAAVADALSWMPDDSDNNNSCSACGGRYVEPEFNPSTADLPLSDAPSDVSFGKSQYEVKGSYTLSGGVRVVQPNRVIYADKVSITPNLHNGKLKSIQADGHVKVQQPGQLLLAKSLSANLDSHKAQAHDVTYLTKVQRGWRQNPIDPEDKNFTGYAHGQTEFAEQLDADTFVLHDATYSTCAPNTNTWSLDASRIKLDRKSGRGQAYNVTLDAFGVPVFYWPYLSFPISDQRQSGFLYGSLGQSSRTGFFASTPLYLNLAPNFDDTLTPQFYTKRGVAFENDFRYLLGPNWLSKRTNGNVRIDYMPVDNGHNPNHHFYVDTQNEANLSPHWNANFNGQYVSDKDYLDDFIAVDQLAGANITLLDQQFNLAYNSDHWNFLGTVQQYQIVDDSLLLENRPYRRLPELDLNAYYPDLLGPLTINLDAQFVNFFKQDAFGETPVNGQRYIANPTVSVPVRNSFAYLKPSITFNNTFYSLENTAVNGLPDTQVSRTLPMYNVDAGLTFERHFDFSKHHYRQTLKPRIFYLYVPEQNQNNIPVFDTTLQDFSYDQLFALNRFAGNDRIGDANQFSLALSSNIYDENGKNIIDGGIGETFFLKHREVSLCNQNANASCIDNEQPFHDAARSDVATQFNYHVSDDWLFHSDLTYNPNNGNFDNQNYQFQYQPDTHHIINFGYQANNFSYSLLSTQQILDGVTPPTLSQITTSFYWAFTNELSLLGYWNYSINANRTVDIFGGLEYNTCSWAVRLIVRNYMDNSNPNIPVDLTGASTTVTMLQFELKGLGTMGSSGGTDLVNQIPGYGKSKAGSL